MKLSCGATCMSRPAERTTRQMKTYSRMKGRWRAAERLFALSKVTSVCGDPVVVLELRRSVRAVHLRCRSSAGSLTESTVLAPNLTCRGTLSSA
jgi:hypothetical protein